MSKTNRAERAGQGSFYEFCNLQIDDEEEEENEEEDEEETSWSRFNVSRFNAFCWPSPPS